MSHIAYVHMHECTLSIWMYLCIQIDTCICMYLSIHIDAFRTHPYAWCDSLLSHTWWSQLTQVKELGRTRLEHKTRLKISMYWLFSVQLERVHPVIWTTTDLFLVSLLHVCMGGGRIGGGGGGQNASIVRCISMYVCVCVHLYVSVRICERVCVYVWVCVWVFARLRIGLCNCVQKRWCAWKRIRVSVSLSIHVFVSICA